MFSVMLSISWRSDMYNPSPAVPPELSSMPGLFTKSVLFGPEVPMLCLERVVLRRHLSNPVASKIRHLRQDICPHTGNLAEEEDREDTRRNAETGCDVSVSKCFAGTHAHEVRDVFCPGEESLSATVNEGGPPKSIRGESKARCRRTLVHKVIYMRRMLAAACTRAEASGRSRSLSPWWAYWLSVGQWR